MDTLAPVRKPFLRRLIRNQALLTAVVIAGLVGCIFVYARLGRRALEKSPQAVGLPRSAQTAATDKRLRSMILGTWYNECEAKQTMTLKDDGTATTIAEITGQMATMTAPRMRFDMVWSVENGQLKRRTVGGEPKNAIRTVLNSVGDQWDWQISELTKDRMVLVDADDKQYEWRRVKDPHH